MFWLFLFCSEPKFAGYLNLSKLCVSFILTSHLHLHNTSQSVHLCSTALDSLHRSLGTISGFYILHIILSRDTTLPLLSCSLENIVKLQESRCSELSCPGETAPDQPSWMSPPGGSTVVNLGSSLSTKSLKFLEAWVPNTSSTCLFITPNLEGKTEKTIINWL